MQTSHWPSTRKRRLRLLDFQASDLFRERPPTLSPFWMTHGGMTEVVPESDSVSRVVSGFAFDGPGAGHTLSPPPGPASVWRIAGRIAGKIAAASERKEAALSVVRARRGLAAGGIVDPTFTALPIFSDLAQSRPKAALPMLRYARYLNELVPRSTGAALTLEIGSGTGLLSLGLRRLVGSRAILVDLPPMLAVAFTVLSAFEGDEAVALPNETHDELPSTPYVLLTPSQVSLIGTNTIDVAVNTASFQEMTYAAIGDYLGLLDRVLKPGGLFYCVNLDHSDKVDGSPIEFDRYPWPASWETLFDRTLNDLSDTNDPYRERLSRKPG